MTDPRTDPDSASGRPDETRAEASPPATDAPSATAASDALERRAFVRRMGTDAVRTAGSVFNLSRMLTRSAAAAGQAVIGELESLQLGNAADEPATPVGSAEAGTPAAAPEPASGADPGARPSISPGASAAGSAAAWPSAADSAGSSVPASTSVPAPSPAPIAIDPEQRAILEAATTAVIAVNRNGHAPQLTTASVLWDGETLRFITLGWSRRTTMLRSDPHVGLLVDGPADGRLVTVSGRARIVEGRPADVRAAAWPVLMRDAGSGGDEAAEARWQELVAADADRAVIVVEPDQVLSGRR